MRKREMLFCIKNEYMYDGVVAAQFPREKVPLWAVKEHERPNNYASKQFASNLFGRDVRH